MDVGQVREQGAVSFENLAISLQLTAIFATWM